MPRTQSLLLGAALVLAASAEASAHIELLTPPPRVSGLKVGPCGEADSTRGQRVCRFRPGASILVAWNETIDHPGHFRIAFDQDGDDDFTDPTGFEDVSGGPGVLVDGIADREVSSSDQRYSQMVTLPAVECENCTLQVIQVMSDKAPYGDGNDIYYQCADLVLSNDAPADPADGCSADPGDGSGDDGGDDDGGDEDGGCGLGPTGASGIGAVGAALLAALALDRRRRARRTAR